MKTSKKVLIDDEPKYKKYIPEPEQLEKIKKVKQKTLKTEKDKNGKARLLLHELFSEISLTKVLSKNGNSFRIFNATLCPPINNSNIQYNVLDCHSCGPLHWSCCIHCYWS